jgi:hypothetical protein
MPFLFTSPYILATPGFSFRCFSPAIGQHFVAFQPLREKKKGNLLCRDGTRGEASTGSAPVKYLKFYYYLVFKYEIV